MSRHNITNDGRTFEYGFDRILGYYFGQVWKDHEIIEDIQGRGEIMDLAEEFGVKIPPDHEHFLALDLPIPDTKAEGGSINIETFDDAWATHMAGAKELDLWDELHDRISGMSEDEMRPLILKIFSALYMEVNDGDRTINLKKEHNADTLAEIVEVVHEAGLDLTKETVT